MKLSAALETPLTAPEKVKYLFKLINYKIITNNYIIVKM